MKPKDWFLVGVRLIGVWWLVAGGEELIFLFCFLMGFTKYPNYTPGTFVIHAGGDVLIGLFLISGPKILVSFSGNWGDSESQRGFPVEPIENPPRADQGVSSE
jgi:hypothetical protein